MSVNNIQVLATSLKDDKGTLVIFEGLLNDEIVYFAADHRPAQDIAAQIVLEGEALCMVPPYLFLTEAETQ